MKILFAITRLAYSGAPKMMSWVANQMSNKGHEVHFVTLFSGDKAQMLNDDITLHRLDVKQSGSRLVRNTLGMMKTIRKLHKKVKEVKPDIMVSFLDSVGYVYLPIGRFFTKCRFIVSERVDPYQYKGLISKVRFFLMKNAHGSVFQTDGAREYFKKYKKIYNNSTVIPNPVVENDNVLEIQKRCPAYEDREKKIVTVGRLSLTQKRQDVLLEAFRIFVQQHPGYKLFMYGDGTDKNKIQSMIDNMGLTDIAVLAGKTNRVFEEIYDAKAFVLSSDFEGIPNALIESMSIGVPSVSTDCSPGGAALLIKDGENGYIVPRADAAALAEKLSIVVDNKEVSERFSKNSIHISEEFSEDTIADAWEDYLCNILKPKE